MAEPERPASDAELKSWLSRAASKAAEAREAQPAFGAEVAALLRAGREDAWNNLIPAFPTNTAATREPGTPGSPTPQMTTEALTGNAVDQQKDVIEAPMNDADIKKSVYGNMPVQPAKENEHQHQREGRGGR